MRTLFLGFVLLSVSLTVIGLHFTPNVLWAWLVIGPLVFIGFSDMLQKRQAVRRNFPLIGRFRYLLEMVRPEIYQYFIESDTDGVPFSREMRSIVYQRAKRQLDTMPFGTKKKVYEEGYEWVNHSMSPVQVEQKELRVTIGGPDCTQPYNASILNISAMSYGSLSKNAIRALNGGAKLGGFAHNTGEGGLSEHHMEQGGDLIWQLGTAYFGCRDENGFFDEEKFRVTATREQVKMIEVKLSQGAKPGYGGMVPAEKVSKEIAEIRGVPQGVAIKSPSYHSAFKTPIELLFFVKNLREVSGGKPVGIKLCIGKRHEFLALCKAMLKTKIMPDYIAVDGGEGGTGAAPLEFSNYVGWPLREGLVFVHNALVGCGLRKHIKVIASGKITTGFDIIKHLAIGADACYSARAMMMALGCIQALRCNTNECPVGVATQKESLVAGLVVSDKRHRVHSFHAETLKSVGAILGAMGLHQTEDLRPWQIFRRTGTHQMEQYAALYDYLKEGVLLTDDIPNSWKDPWNAANPCFFKRDDLKIKGEENNSSYLSTIATSGD